MQPAVSPRSRLVAVVLAVLLGVFGIHRFYVGKVTTGVAQLVFTLTVVLSWVTAIWVIVDVIVLLLGTFTDHEGRVVSDWNSPIVVANPAASSAAPTPSGYERRRNMKFLVLTIIAIVIAYLAFIGIRFYFKVQVSKKIIDAAMPYQKESTDTSVPILVLGDSTAVGVGASSPELSLAGLVSGYLGATEVENYAKSGAYTSDLPGQIANAKLSKYRLILIQTGGNDIIRFHSVSKTAAQLQTALKDLPSADKVVIISAGDVGGSPLFPFFLRPIYTYLNKEIHASFATVSAANGATYVNLLTSPETAPIEKDPNTYLAADGLHPSTAGYELWFKAIKSALPTPASSTTSSTTR